MWRFKHLEDGVPERDPRETEFFRLPQVSDSLVREVIQNSIDAKRKDQTKVKVCFTFGEVMKSEVTQYLAGLKDHLIESRYYPEDFESCNSVRFLTIEDFGTSGLDGNIGEGQRPKKGESNFWDFWWREGISGKQATKLGSFGLGKTTFHLTSKIMTFWGFTIRYDDLRMLLMGKSLLRTHYIGNTGYQYFGYFTTDNHKPISDTEVIQHFRKKFLIARGDDEPGFSLVIPMQDEEISVDTVLKSVIMNFFYPIASDALEVQVKGVTGSPIIIQKNNLLDLAASQSWEGTSWDSTDVSGLLQFIVNSLSNAKPIEITISNHDKPEITEGIFGEDIFRLKELYNRNELLNCKVHIQIRPTNKLSVPTYFMIHLMKCPDLQKPEELWIRSGNLIAEVKSLGGRAVRAMIVAEDSHVNEFLRAAENPSHTDWKENSDEFKTKYLNAARILRFIKKSANKIISILDEPPKEIQKDFLRDIFRIPALRDGDEEHDGEVSRQPKVPKSMQKPTPVFQISQIHGGFRITLNREKEDISLPKRATVMAGYDVRKGDPFAQYDTYDFNFADFKINSKGTKIIVQENNKIQIEVTSKNSNLQIVGFDPNRDVVVKVTED